MARDNGSRGSYRHIHAQQQQPSTPEKADRSFSDEDVTPKAMATSKGLKHIDDPATDHLADQASDQLNARFSALPVPGSMPRRQTDFFRSFGRPLPTYDWKDVAIASLVYGSAAFGFFVILRDGVTAIGGLIVGVGNYLLYEMMLLLGA
ncbi:hypothetical protein VM1G_10347 [Cytospora mali]|uniref:Uncharacterized protein n=1 Tax=Cytospora mali TaxID=578113 RepID=A0A194VHH2_CYTMA|nr:hypothetical protein VM1G_10347 [Valsa mali]